MKNENCPITLMPGVRSGGLKDLEGYAPRNGREIQKEFRRQRGTRRSHLWISRCADVFASLADVIREPKGDLRLLLLDERVSDARREYLNVLFRTTIVPNANVRLSGAEQLVEILNADHRNELVLGGLVDWDDKAVVLYRGDLDRVILPFTWFTSKSKGNIDFNAFHVTDYGQTIAVGAYEVAADAILYEFDPEFRRAAKRRELHRDDSIGGAVQRARLQKGLNQDEFTNLSARQIGRIERGEVASPRPRTLERIARRLGITVDELTSY